MHSNAMCIRMRARPTGLRNEAVVLESSVVLRVTSLMSVQVSADLAEDFGFKLARYNQVGGRIDARQ